MRAVSGATIVSSWEVRAATGAIRTTPGSMAPARKWTVELHNSTMATSALNAPNPAPLATWTGGHGRYGARNAKRVTRWTGMATVTRTHVQKVKPTFQIRTSAKIVLAIVINATMMSMKQLSFAAFAMKGTTLTGGT
mmetsp:Transcript_18053/g.13094  ORF Transcript_18053/g.13094 Transcript_18053/m.13094 type:complete len:137 (-) Transcript_18053:323-733(-)